MTTTITPEDVSSGIMSCVRSSNADFWEAHAYPKSYYDKFFAEEDKLTKIRGEYEHFMNASNVAHMLGEMAGYSHEHIFASIFYTAYRNEANREAIIGTSVKKMFESLDDRLDKKCQEEMIKMMEYAVNNTTVAYGTMAHPFVGAYYIGKRMRMFIDDTVTLKEIEP